MTRHGWALFFVLLAAFVVSGFAGCSHPVNAARVQCQLAALEELPDEPGDVTVSHVVQVVEHVKRCRTDADAGR